MKIALAGSIPRGLNVRQQAANNKVVIRFSPPGGKATAVTVPDVLWQPSDAAAITNAFVKAASVVRSGASLKAAFKQDQGPVQQTVVPGAIDWQGIIDGFLRFKVESGQIQAGTLVEYRPNMHKVLRLAPTAGGTLELLRAAVEGMAPGSCGRKQTMQHISAMLKWAVEESHLSGDAWRAATTRQKADVVGQAIEGHEATDPCTLSDSEIVELIGAVRNPRWKLALQMLATYGLRPVELIHLSTVEKPGWVYCAYRKRTSRGSTQPRTIPPLVPAGAGWTAEGILEQWMDAEQRPPLASASRKVSQDLAQYLRRCAAWVALRERNDNDPQRPPLVPYVFRHSYAARAHLLGKPTAAASQAMGHSHQTHLAVYVRLLSADAFEAAWGD